MSGNPPTGTAFECFLLQLTESLSGFGVGVMQKLLARGSIPSEKLQVQSTMEQVKRNTGTRLDNKTLSSSLSDSLPAVKVQPLRVPQPSQRSNLGTVVPTLTPMGTFHIQTTAGRFFTMQDRHEVQSQPQSQWEPLPKLDTASDYLPDGTAIGQTTCQPVRLYLTN